MDITMSSAIAQLMEELQKGANSVQQESDWVSEEEMFVEFDIDKQYFKA